MRFPCDAALGTTQEVVQPSIAPQNPWLGGFSSQSLLEKSPPQFGDLGFDNLSCKMRLSSVAGPAQTSDVCCFPRRRTGSYIRQENVRMLVPDFQQEPECLISSDSLFVALQAKVSGNDDLRRRRSTKSTHPIRKTALWATSLD